MSLTSSHWAKVVILFSIIWSTSRQHKNIWMDNSKHCAQRWRGEARDWRLSCCSLGDQDVGAGGGDLPTDYHDNHFSDYDGCHDYEEIKVTKGSPFLKCVGSI